MDKLKLARRGVKKSFTAIRLFIESYSSENDPYSFILNEKYPKFEKIVMDYNNLYLQLSELALETNDEQSYDEIEDDNLKFNEDLLQVKYLFHQKMGKFQGARSVKSYNSNEGSDDENTNIEEDTRIELLGNVGPMKDNVNSKKSLVGNVDDVTSNDMLATTTEGQSSFNHRQVYNTCDESDCNGEKHEPFENIDKQPCQNIRNHNLHSKINNQYSKPELRDQRFKLPQIPLPKFKGNKKDWPKFRDLFHRLIIDDNGLSNIEKYYYLQGCIDDRSKELISYVDCSGDGFELAWKALMRRYNNEREIINEQMQLFFNLKAVKFESAAELQDLVDKAEIYIQSLSQLGEKMSDAIIVHTVKKKLDIETKKLWEYENSVNDYQTWVQFNEFLQRRIKVLEITTEQVNYNHRMKRPTRSSSFFIEKHSNNCVMCNKNSHVIYACPDFLKLSPRQRYEKVKQLKLCLKCLKPNHRWQNCKSRDCKLCQRKHNDLLHFEKQEMYDNPRSYGGEREEPNVVNSTGIRKQNEVPNIETVKPCETERFNITAAVYTPTNLVKSQIVLSTIQVRICDNFGKFYTARALLDSASMNNFITHELVEKLQLNKQPVKASVSGLNNMKTDVKYKIKTAVKSRVSNYQDNFEFMVVPVIANRLPLENIDVTHWRFLHKISMADPDFANAGPVDLLLGAEVFYKILYNNQLKVSDGMPKFHDTAFGWIVGGNLELESTFNLFLSSYDEDPEQSVNRIIEKFWEVETFHDKRIQSKEEELCEILFDNTHGRDSNGRYCVELPFKENLSLLGESKTQAVRRFHYLEQRFVKDKDLKDNYVEFMREYNKLGHMKKVQPNCNLEKSYYIPHHAVLKPSSTTTKLRVVFDASAKTSSGVSLNDVLLVGPKIQPDLFHTVLRFRIYIYAFTADIEKMYRQIMVHNHHTSYQKIVWREDPAQDLEEYELLTVTYGTASAPYLATKTLTQLAADEAENYPMAAKALTKNFYVDDVLAGSNDIESSVELQRQLITVLSSAGMNLRKWTTNDDRLKQNVLEDETVKSIECIKTLGIHWDARGAKFKFNINLTENLYKITKRTVLSCIGKLYDPLGLIGPVIVTGKLIMQQLWLLKLQWDEELPDLLKERWQLFYKQLLIINDVKLPRCIMQPKSIKVEIHGFADASKVAYGACIYVRCVDESNNKVVNLVCSKSRVAPLEVQSIPRLELNAALLLARMVKEVSTVLEISSNYIILWSDSTTVLQWIMMAPYNMKTFVAHRVAEIQKLTTKMLWCHVEGKKNPADVLSRGAMPEEFVANGVWYGGPRFLKEDDDDWSKHVVKCVQKIESVPETRSTTYVSLSLKFEDILRINTFSCYTKLLRWTAVFYRFLSNCRKPALERACGPLNSDDLDGALKILIRVMQRECFQEDIDRLQRKGYVAKRSKLAPLSPFLDEEKLIRVGGRISKSSLSFGEKHQYLLPHHHVARLLVVYVHNSNQHCGVQQTLATLRQKYWFLKGFSFVKGILSKCKKCFKAKAKPLNQLLGELPKYRLESCRPFYNTGLDFCRPFSVRYRNQRKDTYNKVYVCVFICMTTKAVHLEVVEDATADAFIACVKRFCSRRGKPATIWSDNGTNFIGANNRIKEMESLVAKSTEQITKICSQIGFKWNFIPPRTPNFGGLWESGVKIFKHHLKRIVGSRVMTLEFLYTIVVEIEGVMNSRPLTAMSSDPNDLEPLTPGHFLIGSAINSIMEPNITTVPTNRLNQWKQLTQIIQHFWKRFSCEYIRSLQQRNRNNIPEPNLRVNDLVLIIDEHLPSTHWMLGRVDKVFPGTDGYVRCAAIRTKGGIIERGISKLAKLPIEVDQDERVSSSHSKP